MYKKLKTSVKKRYVLNDDTTVSKEENDRTTPS